MNFVTISFAWLWICNIRIGKLKDLKKSWRYLGMAGFPYVYTIFLVWI